MLHALLLLPLLGCTGMPDLAGLFGDDAPVAAAPVAPPPKDTAAQVADIRGLLRAGKAAEAAKAAEALLAAHPEDDAVWELVEVAAIRGGVAAELVDRLSADKAIGGRADRHHVLRGVLAVEATRLGDAITAARALRTVAPGDAAALFALAIARGAPAPSDLTDGERGLVALADPTVPLSPAAEALPGWRAALVRAEARLARGDRAGAAIEAAAAESGGARARGLGAMVRVRAAATAAEAWGAAEPAARAQLEAGDGVGVAEILDAALPAALGDWKARAVAQVAKELGAKLVEAGNTEAAARVAVVEAEAALRGGAPARARDAARLAAALPAVAVRASWTLALAGAALGQPSEVDRAAAALVEPRATAARDLAKEMRGEPASLPRAGLVGADAALQALLGAGWLAQPDAALAAAVSAASGTAPDLALWGRLAQGGSLTPAEGESPGFAAERAVRAWLATGQASALPADLPHPNTVGWNALFAGSPAAADAPGVAAWARERVALGQGGGPIDGAAAARELGALATAAPAWRTGPWASLTRLDGPSPEDLDVDAAQNARAADPLPFATAHHGWTSRVRAAKALWAHGVAPLPGAVTAAQRDAVWDAAAAHRSGVLAWIAGQDAWPAATLTALEDAEKAAGLVRFAPPTLEALRSTLDGTAILSFREVPSGIEALYLGEEKGRVVVLPASLARDTSVVLAALRSGESALASGDRLRGSVIDGAMDGVLLGVGRYIVVGAAPVGLLPVAAMPEQADGLRYLASIRHVSYLPDFDALLPAAQGDPLDLSLPMLALCATADEATAVRRVYPDAKVLEGPAATVAAFKADVAKARFLHIGAFPASPDGGFRLADGVLTLGDIAAQPIGAHAAVLLGGGGEGLSADVLLARMAAVHRAGGQDVLVEGWAHDPALRSSMLFHFWEGANRAYSASRALGEARTLALRESGDEALGAAPWGGFFASGRP